jgi:BASS family bile acid:Na+ symporter
MTITLLLLLKAAVAVIILAIGMDSTADDALFLVRRPGLMLRSLLAMYVVVPLAALMLVGLLDLAPGVELGLLVLAASAGAPLLPRKLLRIGDGAYTFSLVLLSSLLAIVVVPTWLTLLGPHFRAPLELDSTDVAWLLAKSFLLPLAVGMLLRRLAPAFAARWASKLIAGAGVVLTACALLLLALHWEVLQVASFGGAIALMALLALALAAGHGLGGPNADHRSALAVACASRHIGIAVLVAASLPGPRTAVIIAAYIVASAIVCIPYLRWRRAVAARINSTSGSTNPQGVRS